jgi:hypothetical protein
MFLQELVEMAEGVQELQVTQPLQLALSIPEVVEAAEEWGQVEQMELAEMVVPGL